MIDSLNTIKSVLRQSYPASGSKPMISYFPLLIN